MLLCLNAAALQQNPIIGLHSLPCASGGLQRGRYDVRSSKRHSHFCQISYIRQTVVVGKLPPHSRTPTIEPKPNALTLGRVCLMHHYKGRICCRYRTLFQQYEVT